MSKSDIPGTLVRDHWVVHPQGRIFARSWTPEHSAAAAPAAPIVLMHDSLGCVALWRDFPQALAAATGRQVIAYDRLGFGQSDPRRERPSLDFVAEEAREYFPVLRQQLGLVRFVLMGHSVGGGMAIECAARYGEGCEALITVAAQVFPEDRTLDGIRTAKAQFAGEGQVDRLARHHGDKARWVLEAWTENWLHPDFARWTLEPVLPQVTCPVLAIHGIHDEYGSTRHPELIGALSTGPARVDIMEETYHVPHRERPGEVLSRVVAFLDAAVPTQAA